MLCESENSVDRVLSEEERAEESRLIEKNRETLLKNLFLEIHTLAYYYKWAKEAILALTVDERDKFISLIRKQIAIENGKKENEFETEDSF